jgi:hypothetical protein
LARPRRGSLLGGGRGVTLGHVTEQQSDDGVIIEFIDAKDAPIKHKELSERVIVMRDAKNPDGPTLYFTEAEWDAFVLGVKDGEFDDLLDEETPEDR